MKSNFNSISYYSKLMTMLIMLLLLPIEVMAANTYDEGFPLPANNKYQVSTLAKYGGGGKHGSYLYTYGPQSTQQYDEYCLADIPAAGGTSIYAVADGKVITNCYGSGGGWYLVINHYDGTSSYYGHMKDQSICKVGTTVKSGDVLGYVGQTGLASGNHLHFEWSGHDPYCEYTAKGYINGRQLGAAIYPHVHNGGSTTSDNSNNGAGNISATVTTGSTDSVTEAGTVLRGSFGTSGVRATECGMYIGTSSEVKNMTKLGSDSVNTYGTNMYYSTSKYGYKLTAGTMYYYRAYAIVNNETYWGDAKSFFVPISIGIGITDVDTTEEEKSGASGSNTSGHQSLTLGTTGDDVKTMQTMLNSVTFAKLSVDGSFGNNTLKALKNYQTQRGLTVDGVCGAKTWSALESDYKNGKKYCTHSSYKFLFAEAAHPHYNYYQCNTCGEKFTDQTTAKMDSCTTCNPVKAVVITKGADNITQTNAIIRGEVTVSGGNLTECGMFIGKTPNSLAFLGRDYISKGTPFYYSTTKFGYPLTAGTTYYYRAYAFVDGKAIWGDMKSFTTLKATATQTATVVGTSGEYLAINNGPASSSAGKSTQIGRIPPGGVVTVDMSKKSGNWYWVTYNGVSGYAYSGYLSLN